jgi:nucleoid DNA-binding protein
MSEQSSLPEIVNQVVRETGLSRRHVEEVIASFLSNIQDITSDKAVHIKGFGSFMSYVSKRNYFDISDAKLKTSIKPKVKFIPSKAFLGVVRRSKEDEIDELTNNA